LTVAGNSQTNAGDIAKPVQMTSGKRTKITTRWASRWSRLYDHAFASPGLNARRTDEKYGGSNLRLSCDVDVEWFGEADPGVIGAHPPLMSNVRIPEFLETVSAIPTNRP
jgi:hypothetical protein